MYSSSGGGSGAGAKRQSAAIDASLLTSRIKGSTDAASLMQLVERYQQCSSFNHIHAAAALARFAKLAQKQLLPRAHGQVWVDRLVAIAKQHLQTAEVRPTNVASISSVGPAHCAALTRFAKLVQEQPREHACTGGSGWPGWSPLPYGAKHQLKVGGWSTWRVLQLFRAPRGRIQPLFQMG